MFARGSDDPAGLPTIAGCSFVAQAATGSVLPLQLVGGSQQKSGLARAGRSRGPSFVKTRSEVFAGVTLACRARRAPGLLAVGAPVRGKAQAGAAPSERSPSASSLPASQLTPSRSAMAASAAKRAPDSADHGQPASVHQESPRARRRPLVSSRSLADRQQAPDARLWRFAGPATAGSARPHRSSWCCLRPPPGRAKSPCPCGGPKADPARPGGGEVPRAATGRSPV